MIGIALALAISFVAGPPTAEPPAPVDDAQAAIDRAKEAARKGDHRTALAQFQAALQVRPSPRLHFNIAVCHHQLMLAEAKGSAAHEEHRVGAVEAYRAYLKGTPDAEDRAEVERIIVELGGQPPRPGTRLPLVHPDDPPAAPRLADADIPRVHPDDSTPPTEPPAEPPKETPTDNSGPEGRGDQPRGPRARVGPFIPLALAHMGELSRSDTPNTPATTDSQGVAFLPMLGLGVRGAAFLGVKRRVHLGAELAFYLQPTATKSRHSLIGAHLVGAADYALPLGRTRRFELAFGGTLGFLYEQLRSRVTTSTKCPRNDNGEVSSRGGLLVGGRIGLLVLLGPRRNHELGLRFGPALAVMGPGTQGNRTDQSNPADCDEPPFDQVGLGGTAGLVTMIDLGYAPRF